MPFINYAGCQDGSILNDMRQQLKEVLGKNLNGTVSKIIDKVSSNQIDECRRLEKDSKGNQTKQFEQAIKKSYPGVKIRNKGLYRKPN